MRYFQALLIILSTLGTGQVLAQNEFGRFYTSPRQRQQLDEARESRPQDEVIITIAPDALPDDTKTQAQMNIIDSIVVNGLVYRSDGKNTAWINNNTTIQGSIENQYTRTSEDAIQSDKVGITLPDNTTRIELKVGQQYDIHTKQIYDIAKDPMNPVPDKIPGDNVRPR